MSRLLDARIATLMTNFAALTPAGQKRFLELLNIYLYASPVQRRQLRSDWQGAMAAPCGCGHDDAAHVGTTARRA